MRMKKKQIENEKGELERRRSRMRMK